MKLNWGHGIAISLILFMAFIVFLAVKMFQTPLAIYEPDYYELGENQESRIDAEKNAQSVRYDFDWKNTACNISFDSIGNVHTFKLLHLADDQNDWKMESEDMISVFPNQTINFPSLQSGLWMVEISGTVNNKPYFIKKQIVR